MTVNVSLCGSIPRSQMNSCSKKRVRDNTNDNSSNQNLALSKAIETSPSLRLRLPRQVSCDTINVLAPPPIIEPPSWAVTAQGDAKLEPVCESLNLQSSVDLTKKAVLRIGRSQNSDVQLLHCTSSRQHALLFHHPNGSCYVVDCGSAHGTYVNGTRVKTVVQTDNDTDETSTSNSTGLILPHRVKKGALIRFGGPGAPTFILKSFSVELKSLMQNLEEMKKVNVCSSNSIYSPPVTCMSKVEVDSRSKSLDALVTLNTRLNAIGSSASLLTFKRDFLFTSARLNALPQSETQSTHISFLQKRSMVSFDEENEFVNEMHCPKKMKMTLAEDQRSSTHGTFGDISDIAIVSPSRQKPTILFNFNDMDRPVVSPTPAENILIPLTMSGSNISNGIKSILTTPLTLPSSRKNRRIVFSEEPPKHFYPHPGSPFGNEI